MAVLRRTVFFLCFIAVFSRFVTAQEAGETRVIRRNGEFQISQVIVFPAVPGALYYTLDFEKLEESVFVPVDTLTSDGTRVELFLGSGSYRYRITSYNRMGLAEGLSDWQEFQVLAAVQPEVETYQPFYGLYYDIAKPDGTITVTGLNFFPESEFALVRHRRNFDWSGIELSTRGDVLRPDSVTVEDGGRAELVFNRKTLRKGMYDVFVRNPGGLWASLGRVQTGFRKGNDFTVSFGYTPLIAAFDYQNSRYKYIGPDLVREMYNASYAGYLRMNDNSYNNLMARSIRQKVDLFNPVGAYIRTAWLPVKTKIGLFGLEGEIDFLGDNEWRMTNDGPGSFFSYMSAAYANLLYQYPLTDRWQLNVRAGGGGGENYHYERSLNDKIGDALIQNMFGYDFSNLQDVSDDSWGVLLNFGFSAQFFAWKNLFFEAGINFQYMLSVYHFMIRPSVGMGWQTGRWAEAAGVKSAIKRGEDPSVPVTDKIKDEYTLSAGWAPMIPYYGINRTEGAHMDYAGSFAYIPDAYGGRYTYQQVPLYDTYRPPMTVLRPFNPGGFYLRAAYIPYRWNKNRLGMEFNLYFLEHLNREEWAEDYSGISIMSAGFFDILYQRILTESLRLNVRAGIGISNPYDIGEDNGDLEIPFAINTGISVQYFFWRSLYAEAGLDFTTSFGTKIHGIFRPTLGVGWQFGKNAETGLR